jgi:site-specific recombinase XerD
LISLSAIQDSYLRLKRVQEYRSTLFGKSESLKKQARIVSFSFLECTNKTDPSEWDKNDIYSYLTDLEKYSKNTQYNYLVQLKAFLIYHGRNDLALLFKPPKRPITLKIFPTDEEIGRMIALQYILRDKLIIQLLSRTGLRVGELCNLEIVDIDHEKRRILIRRKRGWAPKGLKERSVPIDSDTAKLIKIYLKNKKGKRFLDLSESQVRRIVKKAAIKAGVKEANKVSPHSLRHSFAVHFLTMGGDVRSLQKILGHSDLATTAIYLDLSEKTITQAYDRVFEKSPENERTHNQEEVLPQ